MPVRASPNQLAGSGERPRLARMLHGLAMVLLPCCRGVDYCLSFLLMVFPWMVYWSTDSLHDELVAEDTRVCWHEQRNLFPEGGLLHPCQAFKRLFGGRQCFGVVVNTVIGGRESRNVKEVNCGL